MAKQKIQIRHQEFNKQLVGYYYAKQEVDTFFYQQREQSGLLRAPRF